MAEVVAYKSVAVASVASFAAGVLSYVVPLLVGHAHAFASSALASERAAEWASVVGNTDSPATKVFVQVVLEPVVVLALAPELVLLALAFPSPVLVAL